MANGVRLVAACFGVLLACAPTRAQLPVAPEPHLALDELVKEYKRWGLPLPPSNAELGRIERRRAKLPSPGARMLGSRPYLGRGRPWFDTIFAADKQSHLLAYRVPPSKPADRPLYLLVGWFGIGLQELADIDPDAVGAVRPTPNALAWVLGRHAGYSLTFAVQCKVFGWDDLAAALYTQAREQFAEHTPDRTALVELREIAWRFWAMRLTERGTDRKEIERHLAALFAEEPTLRTKYNEWLLGAIGKTLLPRTSKPGTVEALIDDLTEYWEDPRASKPYETEPADRAPFWKLAELGFDAVPALIEHLKDQRLTRTWTPGFNNTPSRHTTVGALCGRLLYKLSDKQIVGSNLAFLDLGPDSANVLKWFEDAKVMGEEKWLLSRSGRPRAGPIERVDDYTDPLIFWLIGTKYPARFPEAYRAWLTQSADGPTDGYVRELLASKLPRNQIIALLEETAARGGHFLRIAALEEIAKSDPVSVRKYLLYELIRVRIHQVLADWIWSEFGRTRFRWPGRGSDIRLARLTEVVDDPACWDALFALMQCGNSDKLAVLNAIGSARPLGQDDPSRANRIRFLLRFLNDAEVVERFPGDVVEIRDHAAGLLAALLHLRPGGGSDLERGPFTRLFIRGAVAKAAAEELERLKK